MARKTREESEKTRKSILEAAFAVFTNKGFTRATLEEIAAAAGVSRGAIYWHFIDKVDLFIALSDEIEGAAGVRPQDIRGEAIGSLEDLKQEILNYLMHFERDDRYAVFYEMVCFRTEYTEELQPILERQREMHREIIGEMERGFLRLKEDGLVRFDLNPFHAALSLIAFINGIIETWLLDRDTFSISVDVPAMLDDFLRGLRPNSRDRYRDLPGQDRKGAGLGLADHNLLL